MEKGNTKQFQAVVNAYNMDTGVTWNVENKTSTGTAINSTGLLTVGSDETAESLTITATSVADSTKSGTATVRVVDKLVITGITVTPAETKVIAGNQKTFQANVTGTAPHTVIWSVSGNSAAGTGIDPNSGVLTVATEELVGTVLTVTATSKHDNSKTASATVTVVQPEIITSIDLIIPEEKLKISPAFTNGEEQNRISSNISATSAGVRKANISHLLYEDGGSLSGIDIIKDDKVSPSRIYFARTHIFVDTENGFCVDVANYKSIPVTINGTAMPGIDIMYTDTYNYLTICIPLSIEGCELSVTSNPPTFADRTEGYNPVPVEKITLKNTGKVKLTSLKAELTGTHKDSFDITAYPAASLAASASAFLTVKPKDGIPAGTYEAEVLISASGIGVAKVVPLRFTVTEAEKHVLTLYEDLTTAKTYSYAAGEVITITALPVSGKYFSMWTCLGEGIIGDPLRETTTFIMPDSDTTVTARYEAVEKVFIESQDYTGKALTPKVSVKDGSTELTEGKDYTVIYKNNVKAYTLKPGNENFNKKLAPQAIITMKGNYKGTETAYFIIRPHGITADDVSDETMTVTYTGRKQTPYPVVTCDGKKLKYGTEFIIPEYEQAKKDKDKFSGAQEYALTVEGRGNYTGCVPIKLIISESKKQLAMSKVTVKGIAKSYPWRGSRIEPSEFKLTNGKDVLVEDKDFTVSYGINQDVGIGTITFRGKGIDYDGDGYSYIGEKTVTFSITGTSMSKVKITGLETKKEYNGWEQRQDSATLTVTLPDKTVQTLLRGYEYTVTYANNVKKGTASVTFTGNPEYGFTGSVTKTYTIAAAPSALRVSLADGDTYAYLKGGVKPAVIVTGCEGVTLTLTEGTDYTVKYENNKAIADKSASKKAPAVIVTGKGNYAGSVTKNFTITAGEISRCSMVIADKTASTKKGAWKSVPTIYDQDGVKLSSSDYDTKNITYELWDMETNSSKGKLDNNSYVNENAYIRVAVEGKGNYAGNVHFEYYRIVDSGKDISKAVFTIDPQVYTGNSIEITSMKQFKENKSVTHGRAAYMKSGKTYTPLNLGTDFRVESYVKNISMGTAKVTFVGMGAYGGRKTVTFSITQKSTGSFWKAMLNAMGITTP